MKPLAQLSWKETYKGFCSLYRKYKLSSQEALCIFSQLQSAWLEAHQPSSRSGAIQN